MKVLRTKINTFTIILMMTVLASLIQLGSLKNDFFNGSNISEWVQSLSWNSMTNACITNCGTGTTEKQSTNNEFKPERIVIESIQLDKKVVSVPLQNGTWQVQNAVANYAEGTSLVNDKEGNVGLFGHAQANAFLPIKDVKKGSQVVLYGKNYKAIYKVTTIKTIKPTQVDVFYPTKKPSVTLITCDGPNDIYRHMVRAELVRIEKI